MRTHTHTTTTTPSPLEIIADYERQITKLRAANPDDPKCEIPSWVGYMNALRRLEDELQRFRAMLHL